MEAFDELLDIADILHGPDGCPWDKKQTFESLRPYVLEEAHELLEAIDEKDMPGMVEELGDILFQVIFFGKLGEKDDSFSIEDIITSVSEKLVNRHPHVFGEEHADSPDDVIHHWEKAKSQEKKNRKHPLEGIPKTLGALARAQKILSKAMRKNLALPQSQEKASKEEMLGDQLLDLVLQGEKEGIDAESAVRSALKKYEDLFNS